MATINAIIFDLDGVLVDTLSMHNAAWREVAKAGGRTLAQQDLENLRGVRRIEGLRQIFPDKQLTPEQIEHYIHIKHTTFVDALQHATPDDILIDNATNLIASAQEMGLQLGIASSSINANRVIEQIGLTEQFTVIANGAVVSRSKPAPDIFVWAAGALGVYPQHALVFEDSVAGIQGAQKAGMITVGVANPATADHADIYFDELSQIALENLLTDLVLEVATKPVAQI